MIDGREFRQKLEDYLTMLHEDFGAPMPKPEAINLAAELTQKELERELNHALTTVEFVGMVVLESFLACIAVTLPPNEAKVFIDKAREAGATELDHRLASADPRERTEALGELFLFVDSNTMAKLLRCAGMEYEEWW